MDLEAKDKYIAEHLMKLPPDTLRYMVSDLTAEVERLTAENGRYKSALREIKDNQNDFCTTCDENVDAAADALNWAAAAEVRG